MKGLSKGRYDETFSGEDAEPSVSKIYFEKVSISKNLSSNFQGLIL